MKRIAKHILLIQVVVLTMSGVFANNSSNLHFSGKKNTDTGSNVTNVNTKSSSAIILHGSLVNFSAAYGKNFFDLNWNTIPGKTCDHFEIERSIDGNNFEKVGEVKKSGALSPTESFYFRDNVRPTIARNYDLYYRLKQVDENGEVSYSKVLITRMYNTRSLASLSITPDPVVNDILINVQLKTRSFVVIKLTDKTGNVVMTKSVKADEEYNTYKLDDTHQLQPGLYNLEIIVNSNERMNMTLQKS
ncbi:MAG: hypothetical protein JST75_14100 [Bacteroidetes bacterium]|nr:hypothetical protein [Bacteroidota bacterium]